MPAGELVSTVADPELERQRAALRDFLESTTAQALRQAARAWGWPLKGLAKNDLVTQMLGYLIDPVRMASAVQTLPEDELVVLTWLAYIGIRDSSARHLQAVLAEGAGRPLALESIKTHMESLTERCLLFYREYPGYQLPSVYRQWIPHPAATRLLHPAADRLRPPRFLSLSEISGHTQQLLSALTTEQPPITLAPQSKTKPTPGKPEPIDPRRPSLVAPGTLARWGYRTDAEQHLARFLLNLMEDAGLVVSKTQPDQTSAHAVVKPDTAWEMATAIQHVQRLHQAYVNPPRKNRTTSWSEWDVVMAQTKNYRVRPENQNLTIEHLLAASRTTGIWLAGLISGLAPDTWYATESFFRLIYHLHRDFWTPIGTRADWKWVIDNQVLDGQQMPFDVWRKTYGRFVEAWLTGPASWLLWVQVAYQGDQPVAFRAPSTVPEGTPPPPPRGALVFHANGAIELSNDWRTGTLRRLLRLISVERQRNAKSTELKLSNATFRHSLSEGWHSAAVAQAFAGAGAPLPVSVQDILQTWQSRVGRYQLYDKVTVVEMGEDVLSEEMRAIIGPLNVTFYQPTPRCIVLLSPEDAPDLITELRRRGYTPRVL